MRGAAKLADVPADESSAGVDCPVDTVVIPGGSKGDQAVRKPGSKNPLKEGERIDRLQRERTSR